MGSGNFLEIRRSPSFVLIVSTFRNNCYVSFQYNLYCPMENVNYVINSRRQSKKTLV